MPNRNKQKGSRFEYDVKHVLEMIGFYVIRAYSSIGISDLIAVPSWNPKGNNRGLLIQCKNQKSKDYIDPHERDHLSYLQQTNSGNVLVVYKDGKEVMVKEWESGEKFPIKEWLLKEYGISIDSYAKILTKYKLFQRPIHLYYVPKEVYTNKNGKEAEKTIAPFADALSENVYYPHVPENHRDKHL